MLSAWNGRIWEYKMQFQYCQIQEISIQYKDWKTHSTFHGATITSSVSMELQSPAIVTLTLNDVLFSIKQFTQALLTMRVTIKMMSAASQWNGADWVRIDRDEEWMKNEKRNQKLLCPICRVDAECREWSNMKIQNAISLLSNTINNNSIQKLKNTQHVSCCGFSSKVNI